MEENKISIEDYKKKLEEFDWFYEMSEDQSVYKRGLYSYSKLLDESNTTKEHKDMFLKIKEEKYKQIIG